MPISPRTPILREFAIGRQLYLSNKRRPFLASFKLTYQCNLHCLPCPYHTYPPQAPSYTQAIQTLHELRKRGNQIVVFEGGEPLLWKDGIHTIHDIIREAKRLFPRVGLTTNGTLPLDVKPDILWVSMDGLEGTHNYLRQAPIYQNVLKNIRESDHPRLLVHITINGKNVKEVPEIIQNMQNMVKGFTIQMYYPYGSEHPELLLKKEDRDWVVDQVSKLKKSGIPIYLSQAGLRAMQSQRWRCSPWLVDNANPDGMIAQGCYLQHRADIDCKLCGFSPIVEISLAQQMNLSAIWNGMQLFF